MHSCVVMCCVLWCVGVSTGLHCTSPHSTTVKFSITSRRNKTGHWIAEVQLGHEAGQKVAGPWEVDVDHTTRKCEDSESVLIAATVTAPPSRYRDTPGPGYELVPGFGYYKFHTDLKNWQEARTACEDEGTHLLIVNSEQEAKAMKPLWDKHPKIPLAHHNDFIFVGFHDQYREGDYVTIFNDSLSLVGYMKWTISEPTGTGHNCGLFGRNLLIADTVCSLRDGFICEEEL